jgi:predicted DNA-binding transcriptional regulator YafY
MAKLDPYLLAALPTSRSMQRWITTPQVAESLRRAGLTVNHVKTVQRRLEVLMAAGVVVNRRSGNTLEWQRRDGASGLAARADGLMSFDEALALQMLKRFATRQLPSLVGSSLDGLFDVAHERLREARSPDGRNHTAWIRKVAVIDGAFQLVRPTVKDSAFRAVSDALFTEHLLEVNYRPKSQPTKKPTPHTVMPLGLVETAGGLVYLVASTVINGSPKPNPAIYRLDRMESAQVSLEPFAYPRDFRLCEYVEKERQLDFFAEKETQVTLRFAQAAGEQLLETPISPDQTVQAHRDGGFTIRGTVVLSHRLRAWLRSLGQQVEILQPKQLRDEFVAEAHAIHAMYLNARPK